MWSETPDPAVQPGDLLAGRYRVVRLVGAGGMGVVVEAEHVDLAHRVAIKFLKARAAERASAVERFLQEARAAVRLKGEHVARVTDVGRLDDGSPYIVMEYLEGQDLAQVIQRGGPMPVELAVQVVLQVCEAVAEAHALGIVHRDLKPANVFLARAADGSFSAKVLDFGISKLTDPSALGLDAASLTATSDVMGSPQYMSPEQMRSAKTVDGRTDIWSLGVVLYEALSGSPPFFADTMPELVLRIATSEPRALGELRPGVPVGLSDVVMRCLAKERDDRYSTVAKLAEALAPFGGKLAQRSLDAVFRSLAPAGMLSAPPPGSGASALAEAYMSTVVDGSRPAPPGPQAAPPQAATPQDTANAWSEARTTKRKTSLVAAGVAGTVVTVVVAGVAAGAAGLFTSSARSEHAAVTATEDVAVPGPELNAGAPTDPVDLKGADAGEAGAGASGSAAPAGVSARAAASAVIPPVAPPPVRVQSRRVPNSPPTSQPTQAPPTSFDDPLADQR